MFNNYKKQLYAVVQIIQDEYDRHQELVRVFSEAANECSMPENKQLNLELSAEELNYMRLCAKLLDKIDAEVFKR